MDKNIYSVAHLVVAAVRILEHQKKVPPDIEAVGKTLGYSSEESHYFCRKLQNLGIIEIVESAFGIKIFIKDYLGIEKLPRVDQDTDIKEDISRFMSQKQDQFREIESIKAKHEQKKKDMFAEIDKKLKDKFKAP